MSGIERDNLRIKQTSEVFTKTQRVQVTLDRLERDYPDMFTDETLTFIDNCCGDGQFLSEVHSEWQRVSRAKVGMAKKSRQILCDINVTLRHKCTTMWQK